jgi:hypothetical protein
MTGLESLAFFQLMAIGKVYGIKIKNIEHISNLIGENAKEKGQVLTICISLNTQVAWNLEAVVVISDEVLAPLFRMSSGRIRMHKLESIG